jgi:prepilin-type N-terminal cleavage/methylation domain-containing protein
MREPERGFTLLEVLGAVALLALVYSTLATVAIRGVRSEGESRRLLEASLQADWELAALELEIERGSTPELGTRETGDEEDGFLVTWEVTPFVPEFGATPSSSMSAVGSNVDNDAGGLKELFESSGSGAPPFLKVLLTVSWYEGSSLRSVTRTTYTIDEAVASERAEQRAQQATQELQP